VGGCGWGQSICGIGGVGLEEGSLPQLGCCWYVDLCSLARLWF